MSDKQPIIIGSDPSWTIEGAGIEEAPINNQVYGRENAAWTRLDVSPSIEEAPMDGEAYVRMMGRWVKLGNLPLADVNPATV
jgi:hypothetical protein